jgi:uncharacterized membrane protein
VKAGDAALERLIGRLLRAGVLMSSACLAGGLLALTISPAAGVWLLQAGLIILIATPTVNVVLSVVEYAWARDWLFAAISTLVLVELLAGAWGALLFYRAVVTKPASGFSRPAIADPARRRIQNPSPLTASRLA